LKRVYDEMLFHGPALQGLERVEACDERGVIASARSAPAPAGWMDRPPRGSWIADPLAIDCGLQLMALWTIEQFGRGSLPTCLLRYRQYQRFPRDGVRIVAKVVQPGSRRTFADLEFLNRDGALVARIEGHESALNETLRRGFRRNRLDGRGGRP
jgi:hypothetical protein